jgi:hypothetical protein
MLSGNAVRLRLGFELNASVVQPKGEAVIDLDITAVNGRAVVKVHDLKFNSTSSIFDLAGRVLSKPLGIWLAGQIGQALNEAIAGLPQQDERIKKVEIIDIQP